jgi:RNA polymerase sigma factor (sigma-70 family)
MPSPLRTHREQNELLLIIEWHARELARRSVKRDADDVVGDVVLYCLERLRSRAWPKLENLPGYISQLVKARFVDGLRAETVAGENATSVALVGQSAGSPESSADSDWDEDQIKAFRASVMKKLSVRVREAYRLVRIQGASYEDAAAQMNVTVGAINQYIWRAHCVFRNELRTIGIETWPIGDGERTGQRPRPTNRTSSRTIDSSDRAIDFLKRTTRTSESAMGLPKSRIDSPKATIDLPKRTDDPRARTIQSSKRTTHSLKRTDGKWVRTIDSPIQPIDPRDRAIGSMERANDVIARTDGFLPRTRGSSNRTIR